MAKTGIQEKFGFSATVDGVARDFGPYDTVEAAGKVSTALAQLGAEVSEPKVLFTCSTATYLIGQLRAAKPKATGGTIQEAQAEVDAALQAEIAPKATPARKGKKGKSTK